MKKLTLLLSFVVSTAAYSAENKYLQCENKIYRQAALVMQERSVLVKDMPEFGTSLAKVLEQKLDLKEGSLVLRNVELFSYRGVECSSPLEMLNSCSLAQNTGAAMLTVDVQISANGLSGIAKFTTPVVLKKFHARTNLQSTGGISLGNGANQVTLDTINAVVQAKVLIDQAEVDLNFETPYWIPAKNSQDSFCRIKDLNN